MEPEPVKMLRLRAVPVWLRGTVVCGGKVATVRIKFSHILTRVAGAALFAGSGSYSYSFSYSFSTENILFLRDPKYDYD